MNDEQRRRAAARFRGIKGEKVGSTAAEPPSSQRLTRAELAKTVAELGLELSDADVHDMIGYFDTSSGGKLSFDDFLRVVQRLPSTVLD